MLKAFFDAFIERLLVRVFGHYAHPYVLTFTVISGSVPMSGGYRSTKQIKFIGSYNGAVELAKRHLKESRAVSCTINTRAGVRVWEGTA